MDMKAKDLMTGFWVLINGVPKKIQAVDGVDNEIMADDEIYCLAEDRHHSEDKVTGIPLTLEILRRTDGAMSVKMPLEYGCIIGEVRMKGRRLLSGSTTEYQWTSIRTSAARTRYVIRCLLLVTSINSSWPFAFVKLKKK